ncbi:hypothetical protein GCM10010264_20040 [Streptomyces globisporus]|nr:hypothetical protein GCM10010264_20040 [Streptomyces globisporus]
MLVGGNDVEVPSVGVPGGAGADNAVLVQHEPVLPVEVDQVAARRTDGPATVGEDLRHADPQDPAVVTVTFRLIPVGQARAPPMM